MTTRAAVLCLLALGGCAAPPPPRPRAPAPATSAPAPSIVDDAGGAAVDDQVDATSQSTPTPGPDPEALVGRFISAANAGDLASAQSYSTKACWQKECASFAQQAQKKFKVQASGQVRVSGDHAVGAADVICDGSRKCDFVQFLLERRAEKTDVGGRSLDVWVWHVSDVTEDEKKASAWLEVRDLDRP